MKKLFLIGESVTKYSFSESYFTKKFEKENIKDYCYKAIDLSKIDEVSQLKEEKCLLGFNITVPYKLEVMDFVDELSADAKEIGAVNTVLSKNGKWIGYNTDWLGFGISLENKLNELKYIPKKAMIFGDGGASKAIQYYFKSKNIPFDLVSRKNKKNCLNYNTLNQIDFKDYNILVQTTPIGNFPDVENHIQIPYEKICKNTLAFDLIYNPPTTMFLQKCKENKAEIINGYFMLENQAEESWKIWNKK